MQNNQKIIAIFGAGGFLGKHLMRQLTKLDYRIKVATRNPYLKGYLKPLGNPGQIELFKVLNSRFGFQRGDSSGHRADLRISGLDGREISGNLEKSVFFCETNRIYKGQVRQKGQEFQGRYEFSCEIWIPQMSQIVVQKTQLQRTCA